MNNDFIDAMLAQFHRRDDGLLLPGKDATTTVSTNTPGIDVDALLASAEKLHQRLKNSPIAKAIWCIDRRVYYDKLAVLTDEMTRLAKFTLGGHNTGLPIFNVTSDDLPDSCPVDKPGVWVVMTDGECRRLDSIKDRQMKSENQTANLNDVLIGNVKISSRYQYYAVKDGDTCIHRNHKKTDDIAADLNRHIREKTPFGRFVELGTPASLVLTVIWW